MRKMPDEQNVAPFAAQPIADPSWRIARLKVARRRKLRQWVARAPECFGGLLGPEFPAVPDDSRMDATSRRLAREKIHGSSANRRQWTLRIDFGSDRVAMMNQIQTHHTNHSARRPRGIGGWLLLLCIALLVWGPIKTALVASSALPALAVRGTSLALGLVALTFVTSFGIAAGIALLLRQGPALAMAKAAVVFSAAMDLVMYLSSYFPSNRMPGDTPIYVAGSLAYHGAWLAYLFRSRRIRNTY